VLEVKQLLERIGKVPVIVNKDVPGFVGTRLHQALIREAFFIVEEGIANVEGVDKVVKASFGRRLAITGPFETCDLGGLDTFLAASVWRRPRGWGPRNSRDGSSPAPEVRTGH